jgi:hypothetical protein
VREGMSLAHADKAAVLRDFIFVSGFHKLCVSSDHVNCEKDFSIFIIIIIITRLAFALCLTGLFHC